ncbi:hypothetical protein [Coralloluteibacterium thermophilus]|uniref:HK97 gp10 family phage protein n=1 Tax=Coralloluteibacterium thermophilum TaxID=2707049 RepID=A0ABV9NPM8_9GAMM
MSKGDFAAQVKAFADKAKARQEAIFKGSAARVLERASTPKAQGGRMPVDTGFLRNSARASLSGAPDSSSDDPPLVFARMKVGDTTTVGWTAAYALRMEHGFMGEDALGRRYAQQGNGFLTAQVQNWSFIVSEVTREVETQIP